MAKRPTTQREIRDQKKTDQNVKFVTILNVSKQAIPVQLRAPDGVSFFVGEQTIVVLPGKTANLPENRIYDHQINNHQKAGRLKVLSAT